MATRVPAKQQGTFMHSHAPYSGIVNYVRQSSHWGWLLTYRWHVQYIDRDFYSSQKINVEQLHLGFSKVTWRSLLLLFKYERVGN